MDDDAAQQFFMDRNNALQDGTIPVVRAFLTQYNIPAPADDDELMLNTAAARVACGISTGDDYWRDVLTLQLNNRIVPAP